MKANSLQKVMFITNIPTPYRVPWWNQLSDFVDLQVIFMDKTEKNRKWENVLQAGKFKYSIIGGVHVDFPKRDWTLHFNPGILYSLTKYKPQKLILGGYDSITTLLALCFAKLLRIECILWYESTQDSANLRQSFLKRIKTFLINRFDKYAVPGESAKANLIALGVKPQVIYIAPNVVNNTYFSEKSLEFRATKEALKADLGLPDKVILFVGQLIERKGLHVLLEAYKELEDDSVGLLIVGDGHLKAQYEAICSQHGLKFVKFVGFQDVNTLPRYFAISDLFVLPSHREVWGLVVNEAMASELPVLCSKYAGCAYDLIQEGENGYTFDPHDATELAQKMALLLNDSFVLRQMGQASKKIIDRYTIDTSVRGILEALN
ncbi:glycosyltransferase family 1 protein [Paenibacillus psychroresistens]|uniref:Glycosyltransferase family 1 protein n=1 Tax=Paenibacillus psychroresistens TaxID=1778678 RepID=A0A6B8RFU3_9BACL|nr:glycosyltransferase family 4 protein [Paenibacillus psychroresistens]QGQ94372.1 glycosyltransferase family 1 protein [Paenibacillus psychroresistens]